MKRNNTLLNSDTARAILGCSLNKLMKLKEDGLISPPIEINSRTFRWRAEDILAYINRQPDNERVEMQKRFMKRADYLPKPKTPRRKTKDTKRSYAIQPHPMGGWFGVEFNGNAVSWKSTNHCCEELAETEIRQRQEVLMRIGNLTTPIEITNYGRSYPVVTENGATQEQGNAL